MTVINGHWEVQHQLISAVSTAAGAVPVTTSVEQDTSATLTYLSPPASPTTLAIDASGIGPGFLTILAVDPSSPNGTYFVKLEIDGSTTLADYPITWGLPNDNFIVGRAFSTAGAGITVLDSLFFNNGFKVWANTGVIGGGGTITATYQTMDWV
jgi:hypothetical protein